MGESASTLYVATEDGPALAAALCALLSDEGYASQGGRTALGWWRRGVPGWTVLETTPAELLLDRPGASPDPRIAHLSKRLGADIFYLAIYDGADVLLVEARADGRWAATGAGNLSKYDPAQNDRFDPRSGRDGAVPRFVLLDVGEELRAAAAKPRGCIRAIARLLAGKDAPLPVAPDRAKGATPITFSSARNAGARVRHPRFGEGVIIDDLGGDPQKLDIEFDDGRRTVLLARFVERLG